MNPTLYTDGYKLDHRRQYPEGTTRVYSNSTARYSRREPKSDVVFFGLQHFLHRLTEWFGGDFFYGQKAAGPEPWTTGSRYTRRLNSYLGPNHGITPKHILDLADLGYIPLEFKALPEGTLVPTGIPMFTVENTHPDFFWVTNYFETLIQSMLWLPCTSATTAYRLREILTKGVEKTGGDPTFVNWQGHDFSFRGMAGLEAAAMSGAGHLLSFYGTDTLPALDWIEDYYHEGTVEKQDNYLLGGSVPATEHSVMCAGGMATEKETFERLLKLYPEGIVSVVSDTWNLWKVLTRTLPELKDQIMARNGKLVIRPDSGDPVKILCGDPNAYTEAEVDGVVETLYKLFPGPRTAKFYRMLDPHIGVIYGDGIGEERAREIIQRLEAKGLASSNVVFGFGSYTYQYVTRDTDGHAMKATWAEINGEGHDLFKKPVTDDGKKFSAKGRLAVLENTDGGLALLEKAMPMMESISLLKPVWRNGDFAKTLSFSQVRANLNQYRSNPIP